jgi:competence protein ComEA
MLDPWRRAVLVLLAVGVAVAVAAGALAFHGHPVVEPAPPAARVLAAQATAETTTPAPGRTIVVAVAGRVRRPGLVTLPEGARVADAVRAAGGPAHGADPGLLNLARRLADGELVVVGVPSTGGAATACTGCLPAPGGGTAMAGAQPAGPVSLNSATPDELDTLPGVGPVTAARIVAWRESHGPFASVDQLRDVPGIGPSRLAQIRPLVTL